MQFRAIEFRKGTLLQLYSVRGSRCRRSNSVFEVRLRRMVHFRPSSLALQAGVGFGPVWQEVAFLTPMDKRSLIAPIQEFAHRAAVSARNHELFHRRIACP